MAASDWVLLGFVLFAWIVLSVPDIRTSLFPVVPVVPALCLVAGFFLNRWINWLGTTAIVVLHVVPVAFLLVRYRRELFPGKGP
jgi:hypothetical protein